MNTRPSVVCFGEALFDGFPAATTNKEAQEPSYDFVLGGAPLNVAVRLTQSGIPTLLIAKVGKDNLGQRLTQELTQFGMENQGILTDQVNPTTRSIVSLNAAGDRNFRFIKGAHETIRPDEVDIPTHTSIFHFGSLLQITEDAKHATDKLIRQAQEKGAILSYDPNYREKLWGNPEHARPTILETIGQVTLVKVNEEEALMLTHTNNEQEALNQLFVPTLELLVITLAERGCIYKTANFSGYIPAPKVNTVDTTGAGDAFDAAVIERLYKLTSRPAELSKDTLEEILHRATIIASITTTQKGALTVFPSSQDIAKFL